ncbi:MAG TPA: PRTRC system protein E [Bryobacteraceae bacterium]|nr:PRTRC system protein E [Bryobacteraceae bacterium]
MFAELMPLLRQRAVIMTISDVGEGLLRINVIPRKVEGGTEENTALTSPLSITGSPEELDRELPGQLASFTESILRASTNLEELKAQHAAAMKAVEAENRKKLDEKRKANGSKVPSAPPPDSNRAAEFKDGKPVFGSKSTVAPAVPSLFEPNSQQVETKPAESASV